MTGGNSHGEFFSSERSDGVFLRSKIVRLIPEEVTREDSLNVVVYQSVKDGVVQCWTPTLLCNLTMGI